MNHSVGHLEELVWVPSSDLRLAGVLHLPDKAPKPKPVLLLHGFTGNKSEAGRLYTDMARVLCSAGYAVLRFDFRCHGDSPLPFEEFRVRMAVEDAENAIQFLKTLDKVDASRFAIVGLSMGGFVATRVAAGRSDIAALVLLSTSPFAPFERRWERFQRGEYVYFGALRIRVEGLEDLVSSPELASLIKAPTLQIHAVDDEAVPLDRAKASFEALNVKKKFLEVKGGHVFNDYNVRREVEAVVLSWIREHL
ncbi:MAG: alpha/beta fold hydrolase [Thermofilaceae archaeon]|nr:alpha/beta fold hydrolase [Thermofilaceae archaeon]MCX8180103.1 alpha/beta fold hydrolase [Thermofilaceae archaeon]MDW8004242.1 alpha/beta fold hydrolase [Thermofilaceae archaeon]